MRALCIIPKRWSSIKIWSWPRLWKPIGVSELFFDKNYQCWKMYFWMKGRLCHKSQGAKPRTVEQIFVVFREKIAILMVFGQHLFFVLKRFESTKLVRFESQIKKLNWFASCHYSLSYVRIKYKKTLTRKTHSKFFMVL